MSLILILVNTTSIGEVVSQLSNVCLPHLTTLFIIINDDSIPEPGTFSPLFEYNCFPSLKQISILTLKEDYAIEKKEVIDVKKEVVDTSSTSTNDATNVIDQILSQSNDSKLVSDVKDSQITDSTNNQGVAVNEHQGLSEEPNVKEDRDVNPHSNDAQPVDPQPQLSSHVNNDNGELQIDKLQYEVTRDSNDVNYRNDLYTSVSYMYRCKSEDRLANLPGGPFKFRYKQTCYSFDVSSSDSVEQLKNVIIEVTYSHTTYL